MWFRAAISCEPFRTITAPLRSKSDVHEAGRFRASLSVSAGLYTLGVGKTRAERTWERPRKTRHAWMQGGPHPNSPPRQVYIVNWRRQSYKWSALVVYAVEVQDGPDPVLNKAYGLH